VKFAGNPVIPNPGIKDFRDPKVVWHAESRRWVMVLAAGDRVRLYSSRDLKTWSPLSEFGAKAGAHGGVWECPDLFRIPVAGSEESRWVLMVSINPGAPNGGSGTQYFVGQFDGTTFVPDRDFQPHAGTGPGVWLDHGRDNYAGVTWSDVPARDGRRLFIGWMSNWDYAQTVPTPTWRSAMTVPRELRLQRTPDGLRLTSMPVAEFDAVGGVVAARTAALELDTVREIALDGGAGQGGYQVDLEFVHTPGSTANVEIELSNSGSDRYRLGFNAQRNEFYSDRTRAGRTTFSPKFAAAVHRAPRIERDSVVTMRILLDRASAELFGDRGTVAMTDIFFPDNPFTTLRLRTSGPQIRLRDAEVRPIASIWRPTSRATPPAP
jgi:fructan beta-fructosidase